MIRSDHLINPFQEGRIMRFEVLCDRSDETKYYQKGLYLTYRKLLEKREKASHKIRIVDRFRKPKPQAKAESESLTIHRCLIGTQKKASLEWIGRTVQQAIEKEGYVIREIVIIHYLKDCMITPKYIKNKLFMGVKQPPKISISYVDFLEQDVVCRIEDEYNQEYSGKYLSRPYRKSMERISNKYVEADWVGAEPEWEEVDYANSDLVQESK